MSTIVVGGHSRNIGKTSLMAGLIAAFAGRGWLAMKITQYGHGVCSINGRACGCSVEEHSYAILEEECRDGRTDSSRFLAAGARRSLWVRTKQGQLHVAMPVLKPLIDSTPFVIIESNSVLEYLRPDLYIVVLDFEVSDFKESARRFLPEADAVVVVTPTGFAGPRWEWWNPDILRRTKLFQADPPGYVPAGLKDFVNGRLPRSSSG